MTRFGVDPATGTAPLFATAAAAVAAIPGTDETQLLYDIFDISLNHHCMPALHAA